MKPHERERLLKAGLMKEPETSEDIEECIRFFYETLRYRKMDYSSGFYAGIDPQTIDTAYEIEPTYLHKSYLYYVLPVLDNEYANYISKLQSEAHKKASQKKKP